MCFFMRIATISAALCFYNLGQRDKQRKIYKKALKKNKENDIIFLFDWARAQQMNLDIWFLISMVKEG